MALARPLPAAAPMSEINTTPLIDVLLVLLVMLVITIPAGTHSLEFDLPRTADSNDVIVNPIRNKLSLDEQGVILWNGKAVSRAELAGLFGEVRSLSPEPEVQFEPDAQASYEASAGVLQLAKQARLERFGFSGTDRYRTFGRAD